MPHHAGDPTGARPEALFQPPPERQPLAARMRPRTLDEFVGQEHLVGERDRCAAASPAATWPRSCCGDRPAPARRASPGCSRRRSAPTSRRSARSWPASPTSAPRSPRRRTGSTLNGTRTILFLDEIHRFNKAQQDALLPHVEDGTVTLIGATTENPYFEVNAALLSRMRVWRLEPLSDDDVATVVRRALADAERGLAGAVRAGRRGGPRPTPLRPPGRARRRRRARGAQRARGRHRAGRGRGLRDADGQRRRPGWRTSRPPPSSACWPTTAPATATTTRSRRSSRACAATTPTPRCTGWPR